MSFSDALKFSKSSVLKARKMYLKENKLKPADWYARWEHGLADEVNAAITYWLGNTG